MKKIQPKVMDFARELHWDVNVKKLVPLSCWANAMGPGAHHGLHHHPMSMISGVYYINAPTGSAPFIVEDPRVAHFMNSPSRKQTAPTRDQLRVTLKPKAGDFILFESWLKHEVPLHRAPEPRLSVAFNFGLARV